MKWDEVLLNLSKSGLWDLDQAAMVLLNHFMKKVPPLSAHDNAQIYNDEPSANYVKISTAARPIKRNKRITVLEGHDKQTAAGFASLI